MEWYSHWLGIDLPIILRNSMEGILPDKVRWRTSCGHVTEVIEHGLRDKEKSKIDVLLQETSDTQNEYLNTEKLKYFANVVFLVVFYLFSN